jgi:hypothetical protein
MTAEQKRNLEHVAKVVKSNYQQLDDVTIIGRIGLVTGKPFTACKKGYELMVSEGLIPEGFIKPETKGILDRMIARNPVIAELFDRLDCNPLKYSVSPVKTPVIAKSENEPLQVRTLEQILQSIKVPKFE